MENKRTDILSIYFLIVLTVLLSFVSFLLFVSNPATAKLNTDANKEKQAQLLNISHNLHNPEIVLPNRTPTPQIRLIASGGDPTPTYTPTNTPEPTPTPDNSFIRAYVYSGHPFNNFPGHAFVKVKSQGSNLPFNNEARGWWPVNESEWWDYDGIFNPEPHGSIGSPDVIKNIYCTYVEAGSALSYMSYHDSNSNY